MGVLDTGVFPRPLNSGIVDVKTFGLLQKKVPELNALNRLDQCRRPLIAYRVLLPSCALGM
jgi:hypothetical protein